MREFLRAPLAFRLQCEIDASIQSRAGAQPAPDTPFFSWTKRLLSLSFSDCALVLFLLFCFFQCEVRYPSTPYLQVTLPRIFLGYSGRFIRPIVCA